MRIINCPGCGKAVLWGGSDASAPLLCAACGTALHTGPRSPAVPVEAAGENTEVSSGLPVGPSVPPEFPEEWEVLEELGRGGMGVVFRARHRMIGREVALKSILEARADDPEYRRRFEREVFLLARLSHPGVVSLLYAGIYKARPWLALELVTGGSLAEKLARGLMTIPDALAIARSIADALAYTHAQGVVHRDLKPLNVLLDATGQVKVTDFGLALLDEGEGDLTKYTRTGQILGSFEYMAPEQRHDASRASVQADLFSLGVIMFELLAGSRPYGSERPSSLREDVPPALDDLVLKLLAKEPSNRPDGAAAVVAALDAMKNAPASGLAPEAAAAPLPVSAPNQEDPSGVLEFTNERDGSILIRIPEGTFRMGSEEKYRDENPAHPVTLSAYCIGKAPVTWKQYAEFCKRTGHALPERPRWAKDDHPVINVSWDDARAYCAWAGLRLATEAEWEYAARGADGRKYPWGDEPPDATGENRANYNTGRKLQENDLRTTPVGSFPAGISPFGALDMEGNVWEWCSDWYDGGYYAVSPPLNPAGPEYGTVRVLRGGSWTNDARYLRATYRLGFVASIRHDYIGFRVAR